MRNPIQAQRPAHVWMARLLLAFCLCLPALAGAADDAARLDAGLLEAASIGDLARVQQTLRDGADLSASDRWGRTALHQAIYHHHKEVALFLVDRGASLGVEEKEFGATPLHFAAMMGLKDVTRAILAKNPDVFAKTASGYIPQHWSGVNRECCESGLLQEAGWNHILTPHNDLLGEDLKNELLTKYDVGDFECSCSCGLKTKPVWVESGCCGYERTSKWVDDTDVTGAKPCGRCTTRWQGDNGRYYTPDGRWLPRPSEGMVPGHFLYRGSAFYDPKSAGACGGCRGQYPSALPIGYGCGMGYGGGAHKGGHMGAGCGGDGGCHMGHKGVYGDGGHCPFGHQGAACPWGGGHEGGYTLREGKENRPCWTMRHHEPSSGAPCSLAEPPNSPARPHLSCAVFPHADGDGLYVEPVCCLQTGEDGKVYRHIKVWQYRAHSHKDANGETYTHTHPFFSELRMEVKK